MNLSQALGKGLKSMKESISRFPLTLLFILGLSLLNSWLIENPREDYSRLLLTLLVGAFIAALGQIYYETQAKANIKNYMLSLLALALTLAYYFIIGPQNDYNIQLNTKTFVIVLALAIGFIWIPSWGNPHIPFHKPFLATFKSFFTTLLFSLVLAAGISAIYYAIDYLIINLSSTLLSHALNLILTLFSATLFLSMIPVYPHRDQAQVPTESWSLEGQALGHHFLVPRFLEILLSYIIIPLLAIYTLILIIYVLLNITGDFWTDNLLEPLLLSYTIIGLIVLVLSYNLNNPASRLFKALFPKILIVIVLFQTIASSLKIQEMGLTHGRYYVILFGVFATITALAYAIQGEKAHPLMVITLLSFSILSIIPPIDAFTISKYSQIQFLQQKLTENNLLANNQIQAQENLSVEEKQVITRVMTYINNMGYTDQLTFLQEDFNLYDDFRDTFGFNLTYDQQEFGNLEGDFLISYWNDAMVIDLEGFDQLVNLNLYHSISEENQAERIDLVIGGQNYYLYTDSQNDYPHLSIRNEDDQELLAYNTAELFDHFFSQQVSPISLTITQDEATVLVENDQVSLKIIVNSLDRFPEYKSVSFYLLIAIK